MGKSSPSPPPAPDPTATAAAQAAANREAAIASQELNMINQYTPYGNVEYTSRGTSSAGTPQYSATQTLSPSQQALFNLQNDAMIRYGQVANNQLNNVATRLSSPLTLSPGQSTGNAGGSYGATRFRTEDVASPEFVPPTAGEGVGGTRTIYEAAPGTQTEVVTPERREWQTVWDPNAGPGGGYVDKEIVTPAVTRQVPNAETPVEQTYTAEGWINTANLPEGWSAQPTPEQIEQARVQWLLDNPPSSRQIGQTYTENGWVDTDSLPEGWTPPTQSTTPTGTTGDAGMFSLGAGGLPPAPVANEQTRQSVYDSIIQRSQPQFDRQYDQLQTRLANQGLSDPNSQAYRNAVDEYYRGQNDFGLAAQTAALGQMSQLYGLEANARDRAVNEMVMERNQPLNELAAMLTGSQVQNPNFINTPQANINPADIMGATYGSYNGDLAAYNAAQQNRASGLGALGNLAGNLGGMAIYKWSDRRLKRDITQIGFLPNGLPVYMYKYNWDDEWHMGLMADEVRAVNPDAVVTTLSGFDAVNYAEAVR